MDALANLLEGPRARGAFLLRAVLAPPFHVRVQDGAPLTLVAMLTGRARITTTGGGAPCEVRPGDIALMRGPTPYTVADDPATPLQVTIHPGQHCTAPDGAPASMDLGTRTWGNHPHGSTTMLIGTYQMPGEVTRHLLSALPDLAHLPANAVNTPLVALLAEETVKDEPGQEVVLDRLLDLVLIAALRAWSARAADHAPAWLRAHGDPVVGGALRLLHTHPEHPWTVAGLAGACGVSRAALARRFTTTVGRPPMAYLTAWRLTLAADLLREPGATLSTVARRVGYGSPFALSAAFKRERGISPEQYRTRTRADPAAPRSAPPG
ncbi:AraC family transcriptional regulator [Nocardiopsis sediminis]|uniref:AraC family transcriptional regulator n=1 Tax=Nocardiopsis sediminis TaxID=1778267 RepID=A0ABV8FN96_9ACTN